MKTIAKTVRSAVSDLSAACLSASGSDDPVVCDPVVWHKAFSMKDSFTRKSLPERELFRWELAFDVRLRLLSVAVAAVLILLLCRIARSRRCAARKHQEKRIRSLERQLEQRLEQQSA